MFLEGGCQGRQCHEGVGLSLPAPRHEEQAQGEPHGSATLPPSPGMPVVRKPVPGEEAGPWRS